MFAAIGIREEQSSAYDANIASDETISNHNEHVKREIQAKNDPHDEQNDRNESLSITQNRRHEC